MNPQKFAVKLKPPRLCLIYEQNGESFFHDFPISEDDLKKPTKDVYEILRFTNPGYLEGIDQGQILGLIERLKGKRAVPLVQEKPKATQPGGKKISSVDKFRNIIDNLGLSEESDDSSDNVDFNAVEKSFKSGSDSDY